MTTRTAEGHGLAWPNPSANVLLERQADGAVHGVLMVDPSAVADGHGEIQLTAAGGFAADGEPPRVRLGERGLYERDADAFALEFVVTGGGATGVSVTIAGPP